VDDWSGVEVGEEGSAFDHGDAGACIPGYGEGFVGGGEDVTE